MKYLFEKYKKRRSYKTMKESKGYLKRERFIGSYMRMITLPEDSDAKKFESEYKDGVLKITIPKKKK